VLVLQYQGHGCSRHRKADAEKGCIRLYLVRNNRARRSRSVVLRLTLTLFRISTNKFALLGPIASMFWLNEEYATGLADIVLDGVVCVVDAVFGQGVSAQA
jgi:hypothetical protein